MLLHTTETMQHNVVIDKSMDPIITLSPSHNIDIGHGLSVPDEEHDHAQHPQQRHRVGGQEART